MKGATVLIADVLLPGHLEKLKGLGLAVAYRPMMKPEEFEKEVAETQPDVIVVGSRKVSKKVIESDKKLKGVLRAGAGVDNIDVKAANGQGVTVCNTPGKNSVAVAELVFALVLGLDRNLHLNYASLEAGEWNKTELSRSAGLKGQTIGIIGFGNVGKEVARRALGFGMNVLFSEVLIPPGRHVAVDGQVCRSVSMDELLKSSGVVSLHVPATKETNGMINTHFLSQLKKDCILINCSRAELTNEPELTAFLKATPTFKYGTDFLRHVPSSGKTKIAFPFRGLRNVLVTCHIGANTAQAEFDIGEGVVENLTHFTRTGRFIFAVNQLAPKL